MDNSASSNKSGKWKERLLSSSLPLEHQMAELFTSQHFANLGEFAYTRRDGESTVEYSADLWLSGTAPFANQDIAKGRIDLLLECKYRMPKVVWLFARHVADSRCAGITLGSTVRIVDEFSPFVVDKEHSLEFEESLPFAYKGVEINFANDQVADDEIKHGVEQLRYALPDFVGQIIYTSITGSMEGNVAFSFIPILVTTAPLYLVHPGFDITAVQRADEIEDFSELVPYLVLTQSTTPMFQKHIRLTWKSLGHLTNYNNFNAITKARESQKLESPRTLLSDLANVEGSAPDNYFGYVIVCNVAHCGALIDKLKSIWDRVFENPRLLDAMASQAATSLTDQGPPDSS